VIEFDKSYRNVFIVDSRSSWAKCSEAFSIDKDVVLTLDFGLKHQIEVAGGRAYYVDKLCSPDEMQKNNLLASEFFKKWHYDKEGNDIFTARSVPFGFAFRIEIWSEYLYYIRLRANLNQLRKVAYCTILVGEDRGIVCDILKEMGIQFETLNMKAVSDQAAYYFDIHKYMYDSLHGKSIKDIARRLLEITSSCIRLYWDGFFKSRKTRKTVYVQIYHPTKPIVQRLMSDANFNVVTSSLAGGKGLKKYFNQRLIPISGSKAKFQKDAELLLGAFRKSRCAELVLSDGTDITVGVYGVIEYQITTKVAEALRILNSVITYVKNNAIHLEIMIANIGLLQTIVDCVLKSEGVPSYLIINGLMPATFGDEAKYATHINSYGMEIKRNYYKNANNVVCLGDPRMDGYVIKSNANVRKLDRLRPTVGIGTSGFNNIDLISHVAVEFDFMFDVLTALQELKKEGHSFSIIIKVRPNGVLEQYRSFVDEYFAGLEVEFLRTVPIIEVLRTVDLYISIYSQTLFEASCLGIPVIYYKIDDEYLDPPFDGKSELTTLGTVKGLKQAFCDFKAGNPRFDAFLDKSVMEKYIGPLDGKNLSRNLDFIYDLLNRQYIGDQR
jgi:hypothetical protein